VGAPTQLMAEANKPCAVTHPSPDRPVTPEQPRLPWPPPTHTHYHVGLKPEGAATKEQESPVYGRVVNLLDPGVTCTATEGKHMQDATWTSRKMSGGHPVPRLCDVKVGARWLCSWFLERQDHCDSENPDSPSSTTRGNDVKGEASIG
jgi:hypothetical protein